MKLDRLPVRQRPGFDCRNGNCPSCTAGFRGDHGVSGGMLWFGVAGDIEGRRVALVLDVLGNAYPSTVHNDPIFRRPPVGGALIIHRANIDGALTPGCFNDVAETCEFVGAPCVGETGSFLYADELYRTYGNNCMDPGTDYTQQTEAFWEALAEWWERWCVPSGVVH